MPERRLGIIMNGATGRVGMQHHLIGSILALRNAGGVALRDGTRVVPDPILVSRNADKVRGVAERVGVARWTTDLDAALATPEDMVYFDAASTSQRASLVKKAIAAGKHVYVEKPIADKLEHAVEIYRLAKAAGVRHGVVHNQIYLPGLRKLKMLVDAGFFGRILAVRLNFGYWVFEGNLQPAQRPSWNYREKEGGGLLLDTMPHWQYVLAGLFGEVEAITCHAINQIPKRWDEKGEPFAADTEDSAYATLQLSSGIVAQLHLSWCTRVRGDDTLTLAVDGTKGSAVAGMRDCWTQASVTTPRPVWNPDSKTSPNFAADWQLVPDTQDYGHVFRNGWENFIRHLYGEGQWTHDFLEGAKGVQLVEAAHRSNRERRWIDLEKLA